MLLKNVLLGATLTAGILAGATPAAARSGQSYQHDFTARTQGTILRITNPRMEVQTYAVVQDKGGPVVTRRPDLSRGLLELLGNSEPAENIGLLKNLTFEVVVPQE